MFKFSFRRKKKKRMLPGDIYCADTEVVHDCTRAKICNIL